MSYLLWQRSTDTRIASSRLVLRAAEVPVLGDALALRDELERLRREQAQIVAEACREARERGHAEGAALGRREAHERLATNLATLAQHSAEDRERLRNEIGALALQVVRKLLGRFADDAVLVALADTAAAEVLPAPVVAVVVHPDRVDAVRTRLAAGRGTDTAAGLACEVRGDAACPIDACRLETGHGSVDVALEAQLARLEAVWAVDPGAEQA